MRRRQATEQQLRDRILESFQRDIGISVGMAQPFVDSVMRCFAGERPYFPAHPRKYPLLQMRAALAAGDPLAKVARDFEVSRATLYRLFPNGVAQAGKAANDD